MNKIFYVVEVFDIKEDGKHVMTIPALYASVQEATSAIIQEKRVDRENGFVDDFQYEVKETKNKDYFDDLWEGA